MLRLANKFHTNLGGIDPAKPTVESNVLTVNYNLEAVRKAFQWHRGKPGSGHAHVLEFAKYAAAVMTEHQAYLLVDIIAWVRVSSVSHHRSFINLPRPE